MSYADPNRKTYAFGVQDFTAGETFTIAQPSGKNGVLRSIDVQATVAFTADTTEGFVQVGTAADPDKYGVLAMGTTAATAGASTDQDGNALGDAVTIDEDVVVTLVAPTGGVPAGSGAVQVVIDWDW